MTQALFLSVDIIMNHKQEMENNLYTEYRYKTLSQQIALHHSLVIFLFSVHFVNYNIANDVKIIFVSICQFYENILSLLEYWRLREILNNLGHDNEKAAVFLFCSICEK